MDPISPQDFQNTPIELTSLPKYEEVGLIGFSSNYLVKQFIRISIFLLVFLGVALVVHLIFTDLYEGYFPLVMAGIVIVSLWNYYISFQWQKRSGYAIRERDIIFKRGFLVERTTVVPFGRVQHVSTSRDALDKLLGLSRLKIFTAGGSGSDISLPGLNPSTAADLKEAVSIRISSHV